MAARAHDVAALSIKGSSTILNFPQLVEYLPRPASVSPRDVQAGAAKAADMDELKSISSTLFNTSMETTGASEELGQLIELPSLEGTFDSADRWVYPLWDDLDGEFYGRFFEEIAIGESLIPTSILETMKWT
ncbi:hypothetical protein RND71_021713 [Anisodus tanguticus]|uniref:Uncharacterized protein n=1 Tax=Anisodus tanguticus TaxID=243964 RepID=A0AAE1VFH4_9SOLA|nr:hypothetical protein RND71_021713 [Anisodus tanguticus]